MSSDQHIHQRRSTRLSGYDYSQPGAYFITICAKNRECLFGEIVAGEMRLNEIGGTVKKCWLAIQAHFPHVTLDQFVVMPNHIHGIIFITNPTPVGANNHSPDSNSTTPNTKKQGEKYFAPTQSGTSKTIGSIVRGFKIGVTKWARQNTSINDIWQRNYYDHIIRDETDLHRIHEYIQTNPLRWELDSLYLNV